MTTLTLDNIRHLSVAERIQLVEDIWDTIAATPELLEMTEAQRQELDNRLQAYQRNPDRGAAWEEVKARINSQTLQ